MSKAVEKKSVPMMVLLHYGYYQKNGVTYQKALQNKDFELALSILEESISNVGGIEEVLMYSKNPHIYNVVKSYYNALILNKKYLLANELLKKFLHAEEVFHKLDVRVEAFGVVAPLMLLDIHTLDQISTSNRKNSTYLNASYSNAVSYIVSKEIKGLKDASTLRYAYYGKEVLSKIGKGSIFAEIHNQLFVNEISLPEGFAEKTELEIKVLRKPAQLYYLFALGLLYFSVDKEKAIRFFKQVIVLVYELDCENDDILAQSYALIDYLNHKN